MGIITVSVGISAFNEENNIENLLMSLLRQKEEGFAIENILVVSDGSTDKTVEKILGIDDSRIELIVSRKRVGKPERINQLFCKFQSDIAVIMDADIKIDSSDVIRNLVKPLLESNSATYSSGFAMPLLPKTFVQKIAWTGADIWNDIRNSKYGSPLYFSEGSIRAFKKKLYKEMKFPSVSADDVFPFLYCAKNNYPFVSVKEARVYYKLPETFVDYIKQYKRFTKSKSIQENNYGKKFVDNFYTINFRIKLAYLIKRMKRDFVWTALYLIAVLISRTVSFFDGGGNDAVWETVSSSKKLD